jgi:hypothetical protein
MNRIKRNKQGKNQIKMHTKPIGHGIEKNGIEERGVIQKAPNGLVKDTKIVY